MTQYNDKPVKMMMYPAMLFLLLGLTVGLFLSWNVYIWPNYFVGEYITFGRLRPVHVSSVLFLWLLSAGVGIIYFMVQRLCETQLWSRRLAVITSYVWWFVLPLGVLSFPFGTNSGWEYAELPMWVGFIPVKPLFVLTWCCIAFNVLMTIKNRVEKNMYVTLWYFIGVCFWTAIVACVGFFLIYMVPQGISRVNVNFFYVHNVVGFIFTPIGLGTAYYILPQVIQKPLYSHSLSMLGFWCLAFIYTWVGSHHIIHGPVAQWLQTLSIVFSGWLIIPVVSVVFNLFMTMKGAWRSHFNDPRIYLILFATMLYLLVSVQGSLMALRAVNSITSKTDWTIAHAHMALMGTFSFITFAAYFHIIPEITGYPLASIKQASRSSLYITLGTVIYILSLMLGGFFQGRTWSQWSKPQTTIKGYFDLYDNKTFLESLADVRPFWFFRGVGGTIFLIGVCIFYYVMIETILTSNRKESE